MVWFEDYHFIADPYAKLNPFKTDLGRFEWNRSDMSDAHSDMTRFVENLSSGQKSGMRVIGAIGSGKTWFARIVEKVLLTRQSDSIFVYTKVPRIEPTFSNVYHIAIQDILTYFEKISEKVRANAGRIDENGWLEVFEEEDLGRGLNAINSGGPNSLLAKSWLLGNRITSSNLNSLNIVNSITSDFKRFQILVELFRSLSRLFQSAVLVVDELENAPIRLAGGLSDGLRDMLDEFTQKFGMLCLFTAESFDEWYEAGYTEALTRRLDFHVSIEEISSSAVAELVRKHHAIYRDDEFQGDDQLFPFTEEAILKAHQLTSVGRKYPGYFFPNCQKIAQLAHEAAETLPIGGGFVESNVASLPYFEGPARSFFEEILGEL